VHKSTGEFSEKFSHGLDFSPVDLVNGLLSEVCSRFLQDPCSVSVLALMGNFRLTLKRYGQIMWLSTNYFHKSR
jgi:hypothetical protein